MKFLILRVKDRQRGQSFVELSLVILILALLLAGVVELGYLINSYLHVFDAAREAARFSNSSVAFDNSSGASYQTFYVNTAIEAIRVMPPITLNGNRGDDVVISVFSVAGASIRRWPDGYVNGWSLCNNRSDSALQSDLNIADWNSCTARSSHFTTGQILALMDSSAPASGVLLVEIYYNYPQILKLPVFAQIIPDPIPVYVYSVMPLSSAEPTATPIL
ncbi:MAG: TadE/TadG family type IV pilus assembly protein [Chloroflexota bacterium]